MTMNSDGFYNDLIDGIKKVAPIVAKNWNEKKLSAAKEWYGKPLHEVLNEVEPSQRSAERSKQVNIPLNTLFIDALIDQGVDIYEEMADGYDHVYKGCQLEDKNACSQDPKNRQWVGNNNGGKKVDVHLLKRFQFDDMMRIIGMHVSIVDLSKTQTEWKSTGGARSILQFTIDDLDGIIPVLGEWYSPRKSLFPTWESVSGD